MARLYADEDFDYSVVVGLRRLGHDVLTVQEDGCGGRGIPDHGIIAIAHHLDRAVLTFNRLHFIRLHEASRAHKGIIVCTRDPDAAALAGRIHARLEALARLDGELIRINRPG
jgi:hypothetical protein